MPPSPSGRIRSPGRHVRTSSVDASPSGSRRRASARDHAVAERDSPGTESVAGRRRPAARGRRSSPARTPTSRAGRRGGRATRSRPCARARGSRRRARRSERPPARRCSTRRASAGGSVVRSASSAASTARSSTSASSRSSASVRSHVRLRRRVQVQDLADAPARGLGVGGVLAPGQPALDAVRGGLRPRQLQQRAEHPARARRHAEQRAPAGRGEQPVEDGLGLVGGRVADRDRALELAPPRRSAPPAPTPARCRAAARPAARAAARRAARRPPRSAPRRRPRPAAARS